MSTDSGHPTAGQSRRASAHNPGNALGSLAAVAALQAADAIVVIDDSRPAGVVTRQDVLGYLAT